MDIPTEVFTSQEDVYWECKDCSMRREVEPKNTN